MAEGWMVTDIRNKRGAGGKGTGEEGEENTRATTQAASFRPLSPFPPFPFPPSSSFDRAAVGDDAHDVGLGGELAVDVRLAVHALDARADAQGGDGQHQRVAGDDGAAEARVVDAA